MSGMQCQFCSNPATVHLTTLTGFKKKVVHLCESCAKKKEMVGDDKPELNIQAVVHFMLGQQLGPEAEELSRLTCPHCGIKYMEFRGQGRLGCPHDYEAFRLGLDPILKRVHRSVQHAGKRPPHYLENRERLEEMVDIHRQLREAIEREDYELAARLRDLIRQKEAAG
jgi:protein arginine kinase activator